MANKPVDVMSTVPNLEQELLILALKAADTQDSYAAIELLEGHEPVLAAAVYEQVQLECYWKRKDLPSVVALSRAGIQFCLGNALKANDPKTAGAFRETAKGLAYNLASFTWTGWDEAGIVVTSADLKAGQDAARLNLRLAEELKRPAKGKANAHWILGAHELAVNRLPEAKEAFHRGKTHAVLGGETLMEQMFEGYSLLTEVLDSRDNAEAKRAFDDVVKALNAEGSEDAREYARQLTVALTVFSR
ncbi:MAG TPA: hypothetical protein VD994_06200 [Prosthecobacter sp.]|nr:hypothetical protein [Prosthecobacter sp.]